MEAKKDLILSQALEIFQKYGIKSISMDDLSSSMHMSKKTVYKYFKNKEDLVAQLFLGYVSEKFQEFQESQISKKKNAIDYLIDVHSFLFEQQSFFTPAINYDIQTNYPHIFNKLHKKTIENAQLLIEHNVALGQAQKLYRKNINTYIIIYIFSHLSLFIEQSFENTISSKELFHEILRMFIYSVSNSNGISYYESITDTKE
ncbi:MAG: TetR/AcrR family transcriptional regulator [Bacteroidales bacterium]|jgi:AcrR family transcriptional regulator|nr:TetR/AcrR family transcriptional regulator [Bacteroidales bacterium]